ncbi:hypothetical protein HPB50_022133 [Hyalomma asiaticum]|uniref:Uncharacterized protein n=1 Tax=Hyalomma asiaticum TaxID=266040 RepID=A0ACB7TM14_HYAAI|nr:hypothetical protein HPB50_022133 [Hyalomma asiaticum]
MVKKKVTHPTGINWSDVRMNYQSTRNRLDRTKSHLSKLLDQMVEAELEMKDRLLNNIAQFTAQVQKLSAELAVASPEVILHLIATVRLGTIQRSLDTCETRLRQRLQTKEPEVQSATSIAAHELKKVLRALKLMPTEYRRRFLEIKKEVVEPASGEAGDDVFLLFAQQGDRVKPLMPPQIRSFVTQNERKGWLQAKDLAKLVANFEESMLQNTSHREATAKERPHIQQGRHNYARDLAGSSPGRLRVAVWQRPQKEVSRIAVLNEHTREISSLVWSSEKPVTNSVSTGKNQVQIFVGEGVCTARIDSGADITIIRAGNVPKELHGRSGDRMKLTGPFVTPESATSADVLMTPSDYESLSFGKSRTERNLEGSVCSLVERLAEQEVILTSRNGLDTATTFCDDNKTRDVVGEEPNKGGEDVCCEVTLEPPHESEDTGDKISAEEAEPASEYGEQTV